MNFKMLAALVGLFVITGGTLKAHGGNYTCAPVCQVTPPPTPDQTPDSTPNLPSPVTPRGPGGTTGGLTGPGGGSGLLGGTTGGARKKASGSALTWANWWFYNDDRFLRVKVGAHKSALETDNRDLFLGDDSSRLTVNQINARRFRTEAVPKLIEALNDPYYDVRAAAVIALAKCGSKGARLHIFKVLSDPDYRVRESACLALGILGDPKAVPALVEIMKNDAKAQRRLGRPGRELMPRTRAFAAVSIGLIGSRKGVSVSPQATEALREIVRGTRGTKTRVDLEVGAVVALGLLRASDQVPTLVSVLRDRRRDRLTRAYAATALGRIGDPSAREVVFEALKDRDVTVCRSAAVALGGLIKPWDKEASRQLGLSARAGADIATRCLAIMSLARIGGEENRNLLVGFLKGSFHERNFAAIALGIYFHDRPQDPHRKEVAELLHEAMGKTKNPDARGALGISLGLIGHDKAAPDFLKLLKRGGPADLRSHLCLALGLLENEDAIPTVREIVREKGDQFLRRNAALSLGLVGDPGAMEVLHREIDRSANSLAVLGAVTQGLGLLRDAGAVPALVDMATNRKKFRDNSRAFATVALGILGDKDEIPVLSRVARNENYFASTDAIAELLTIL